MSKSLSIVEKARRAKLEIERIKRAERRSNAVRPQPKPKPDGPLLPVQAFEPQRKPFCRDCNKKGHIETLCPGLGKMLCSVCKKPMRAHSLTDTDCYKKRVAR